MDGQQMDLHALGGSFRDPRGFVYEREGVLYRQLQRSALADYELFHSSGLYGALAEEGLLVSHEEVDLGLAASGDAYRVIRPERVAFVSYPYEWCFGQWKDAALLTLEIQQKALARGMTLVDASAYNVQFRSGRPIHIDTLSFEAYREGRPWQAYRQFCRHFLAPLALMSMRDVGLGQLMRVHVDGVPLELASGLLPLRSRCSLGLWLHVHLHARSQRKHADRATAATSGRRAMTRYQLVAWIDSLRAAVHKLRWKPGGSEWYDYYERNNNYGEEGLAEKERALSALVERAAPRTVFDLGANTGRFTRLAVARGAQGVAFDIDPGCVEANYRKVVAEGEQRILPLLQDLASPSPGLGWGHRERMSLAERGPADLALALGLIHHLAIAGNVPLARISSYFRLLGRRLVVEWIPKEDSQVVRLLASREDVFPAYRREDFERCFARDFTLDEVVPIPGTRRALYGMTGR